MNVIYNFLLVFIISSVILVALNMRRRLGISLEVEEFDLKE